MSLTDRFQTHSTLSPHSRGCADKVIQQALGKPWEVGARGPAKFDCWGFVSNVLTAASLPALAWVYPVDWRRDDLFRKGVSKAVAEGWKRIPDRTPYSVILLGVDRVISHVAIYHPSGTVYHCVERIGVVGHPLRYIEGFFNTLEWWGIE